MRAAVLMVSVIAAGCSLAFAVDDAAPAGERARRREGPIAEVSRAEISDDGGVDDAGVDDVDAMAPAVPCPPPIIQKRLGIVCD